MRTLLEARRLRLTKFLQSAPAMRKLSTAEVASEAFSDPDDRAHFLQNPGAYARALPLYATRGTAFTMYGRACHTYLWHNKAALAALPSDDAYITRTSLDLLDRTIEHVRRLTAPAALLTDLEHVRGRLQSLAFGAPAPNPKPREYTE